MLLDCFKSVHTQFDFSHWNCEESNFLLQGDVNYFKFNLILANMIIFIQGDAHDFKFDLLLDGMGVADAPFQLYCNPNKNISSIDLLYC